MEDKDELIRVGKYNKELNDILNINIEELVKRYSDNVMIGIKLDTDGEYLCVSTMHDIQESKIQRRLFSGRLKQVTVDKKASE